MDFDRTQPEFGEWLKRALVFVGLNQTQLAAKMSISATSISGWCNGKNPGQPSMRLLDIILNQEWPRDDQGEFLGLPEPEPEPEPEKLPARQASLWNQDDPQVEHLVAEVKDQAAILSALRQQVYQLELKIDELLKASA